VLGTTGVGENCTFFSLTILISANTDDTEEALERKNGIVASLHVLHDRMKNSLQEWDVE
jgi:hypothetical protein